MVISNSYVRGKHARKQRKVRMGIKQPLENWGGKRGVIRFFRICVSSIHSILFSWEGCFNWLQPHWWLENHHHPVLSWADILSTLDWLNWECSGKLGHQPFWWFQHGYFRPTVDARWLLFSRWNPSEELKISWVLWEVHVFPCGPHEKTRAKTSPAMENPEMTCFPKGGLGNAIAVSHIQLPGWFKAKRPDGKHGDRPKYSCLISQRFRRHVVMKTFPWRCSTRNWGYNQYKIGDIHLKYSVCFDGDRESGSKLLSSLKFCWIWLAIFPIGNPLLAESISEYVFVGVPYADSSRGFKGLSCPWVGDAQWLLFFHGG